VARGSGIDYDLRRDVPYSVYPKLDFVVPTSDLKCARGRYDVRMIEMEQSLRIIEQAMKQVPGGPFRAEVPHLVRPPAGEAYAHIEAPKGELGFYLVSDSSIAPYRCHVRPTSLINLTALREMVQGHMETTHTGITSLAASYGRLTADLQTLREASEKNVGSIADVVRERVEAAHAALGGLTGGYDNLAGQIQALSAAGDDDFIGRVEPGDQGARTEVADM